MINDADGVYTKTQAYNFLKDLLGISKKALINKKFFSLFFKEFEDNFYLIKRPEDVIKSIFTKEGIVELNKMYYQKKNENPAGAEKISQKIMQVVRESLAA